MSKSIPKVVIITFCRKPELFYGSSLIFESIRVGFPDAQILVVDNGSIPESLLGIKDLTESLGGHFLPLKSPVPHASIIKNLILTAQEPLVILDPDIVFWDRTDEVSSGLMDGRLIPTFNDPYTDTLTKERLHTSFLKVNAPKDIQRIYKGIKEKYFDWNPFDPAMFQEEDKKWIRYDTLSMLYATLKGECSIFNEEDLNAYDHLFCGSHIDLVASFLPSWAHEMHEEVKKGNVETLRGAWKKQEEFFTSYA